MSKKVNQYQLKGRIWIDIGDKNFMGRGKAELLKKTADLGSLRKASMELGMSYRQAWYHIERLNKVTGTPLIMLQRGGKNGGRARITEFGEQVLEIFEKSQIEFEAFLKNQSAILNA